MPAQIREKEKSVGVSSSPPQVRTGGGNRWPFSVIKPQMGNGVVVTSELFIGARAKHCFDIIMKQLEEAQDWDTLIVAAKPLSPIRGRTGTTSHLTVDLGGKRFESLAMICLSDTNHSLAWVSNDQIKLTEEWRLKSKSNGTIVNFALHYSFPGIRGWIRKKLVRRRKVEIEVHLMVNRLKSIAENGNM